MFISEKKFYELKNECDAVRRKVNFIAEALGYKEEYPDVYPMGQALEKWDKLIEFLKVEYVNKEIREYKNKK